MKTHLIIPDPHAHPSHHNDRAIWLGDLIVDIKPDVVIEIGDGADMPSLASYDKGKKSFLGKTYQKDINAYLDFQDKLWHRVRKQKKKMPLRIKLIGNHEERINKAVNLQPELEGTIGLHNLDLVSYYDIIIPYDGNLPGITEVDSISYAHFFTSGNLGSAISSEHTAYQLLIKNFSSSTQGHSHKFDYCVRSKKQGSKIMGLSCGCFFDYHSEWAGAQQEQWWRGVCLKRNVNNGEYDLQLISLESLKNEYQSMV